MVFGASSRILCVVMGLRAPLAHSLAASGAHDSSTVELGLGNSLREQAHAIKSRHPKCQKRAPDFETFLSWVLVFTEPLVSLWGFPLLSFSWVSCVFCVFRVGGPYSCWLEFAVLCVTVESGGQGSCVLLCLTTSLPLWLWLNLGNSDWWLWVVGDTCHLEATLRGDPMEILLHAF